MKKNDLDLPATKRDLQKFVTKTEFRRATGKLATKEELKALESKLVAKLATKEELRKTKQERKW